MKKFLKTTIVMTLGIMVMLDVVSLVVIGFFKVASLSIFSPGLIGFISATFFISLYIGIIIGIGCRVLRWIEEKDIKNSIERWIDK